MNTCVKCKVELGYGSVGYRIKGEWLCHRCMEIVTGKKPKPFLWKMREWLEEVRR